MALLWELDLLRERCTHARRASLALQWAVRRSCGSSRAICDAMHRSRQQWRAWRAGMTALGSRSTATGERRVLRVCPRCESVCFGPPGKGDAVDRLVEQWVQPPLSVREQLRSAGWRGPSLSHTLCPTCEPVYPKAIEAEPAADPASRQTWSVRAAHEILSILAELDAASARIMAQLPGLDGDEAFDMALATVVDELARRVPSDDLLELRDALCELLNQLRDVPPAESPDGRSDAREYRAGRTAEARFRPSLRKRP